MNEVKHIFCDHLEEIETWCKRYNVQILDVFDYPIASFVKILIPPAKLLKLQEDKEKVILSIR